MAKKRIQVYADEETKRRVELAAAKHNVPVTEYCLEAIKTQLAEDDLLEADEVTIAVNPRTDGDYISHFRQLREAILAERGGKPLNIDIAAVIAEQREERDEQLSGLR